MKRNPNQIHVIQGSNSKLNYQTRRDRSYIFFVVVFCRSDIVLVSFLGVSFFNIMGSRGYIYVYILVIEFEMCAIFRVWL